MQHCAKVYFEMDIKIPYTSKYFSSSADSNISVGCVTRGFLG